MNHSRLSDKLTSPGWLTAFSLKTETTWLFPEGNWSPSYSCSLDRNIRLMMTSSMFMYVIMILWTERKRRKFRMTRRHWSSEMFTHSSRMLRHSHGSCSCMVSETNIRHHYTTRRRSQSTNQKWETSFFSPISRCLQSYRVLTFVFKVLWDLLWFGRVELNRVASWWSKAREKCTVNLANLAKKGQEGFMWSWLWLSCRKVF